MWEGIPSMPPTSTMELCVSSECTFEYQSPTGKILRQDKWDRKQPLALLVYPLTLCSTQFKDNWALCHLTTYWRNNNILFDIHWMDFKATQFHILYKMLELGLIISGHYKPIRAFTLVLGTVPAGTCSRDTPFLVVWTGSKESCSR